MNLHALYHRGKINWAYAYDEETLHVRLRTARDDADEAVLIGVDKYDAEGTKQELPMTKLAADAMFDYWQAVVKPPFRRLSYTFRIRKGDETVWITESDVRSAEPALLDGFFEFPYLHPADVVRPPEWAKDAVFYQIFPERFANGDPANDPENVQEWGGDPETDSYFGGDLQGVLDHLDHLTELGVNAIYFTPLFKGSSNHKYDTIDYKRLDPQYGSKELLKQVVDACHERGIRVVLDAVFNHSGEQFPQFQDVVEHGEKSRYKDWFFIHAYPVEVQDGKPTYETFGFFGTMPKLNTANPEVQAYLLEVTEYWMRELGIDGWRLDVANEINHGFWREFRLLVKSINPDAFIIGEVWNDSAMWLLGDQFDSVMNYPFTNIVLEYVCSGQMDGAAFADKIGSVLMRYPQQVNEVLFNLLGSHDTPRVLTSCAEDKRKLKLAAVFMFTFHGTPCIFYGDEIGLTGGGDPDCRACMEWDSDKQDRELFDFYKMMIGLRNSHPALRAGDLRFLHARQGDTRILYERIDADEHFIVWMNNADAGTRISHPMETDDWHDALTGEHVPKDNGNMRLELEPYGFRILTRKVVPAKPGGRPQRSAPW